MVTSEPRHQAVVSRRTYLAAVGTGVLSGLGGCAGVGRPSVRMESGSATLHPATELYIANGLQPNGDDQVYVRATDDESPELIGPAADGQIADTLRNTSTDQFHIVVQLRSTPDRPMELWPASGGAFKWTGESTLRATVEVSPWGPLNRIDDEVDRERLRTADELVYTAVWTMTPAVADLPDKVVLSFASRS